MVCNKVSGAGTGYVLLVGMLLSGSPALALNGCNAYMVGMHDYNDTVRQIMTVNGEARGWMLVMQSLDGYGGGQNAEVVAAANAGFGVVTRLHWGYGTTGTLPWNTLYDTFAQRAATFIQTHMPYCKVYHIGNEPTLCGEWPGGGAADGCCNCQNNTCYDVREKITVERYADCYRRVYNACVARGITGFRLAPAPTGTWAGDFRCPQHTFDTYDYVCYETRMYELIPHSMIGALTFHPKTSEHVTSQITSNEIFPAGAVFGCNHNQTVRRYFREYRDRLDNIPSDLRDRPIFLTELNPHNGGWTNNNNGYVVAALNELALWNSTSADRKITALMLYRWDDGVDLWDIHSRPQVHNDLRQAVLNGQTSNGLSICGNIPPTSTPTPDPGCTHTECFSTLPSWDSLWNRDADATWTSVAGGHEGNALQASISASGSSARVRWYAVSPNTTYTIRIRMRTTAVWTACFWMETGFRLGNHTAQDFDQSPASWTFVKKFDGDCGSYENGNTTWLAYETSVNTGSSTAISIGYKMGSAAVGTFVGQWDSLDLVPAGSQPTSTPTRTATRTPTFTNTVPGPTSTPTVPGPTNTPPSGDIVNEPFTTMPAWTSTYDAGWGSAGAWAIASGGQAGTFLQGSRSTQGSSARVSVYTVPANTNITVAAYLRCPSHAGEYWMEFGYRLGANTAQNFDDNVSAWTLVKKFDNTGSNENGNGNTWTLYSAQLNTGSNTQISIGYKLGSFLGAAPTTGWDSLRVYGTGSPQPTATPALTQPGPTNTPPAGDLIFEPFDTMPSWSSTFSAGWGSDAAWSIAAGGQTGTHLNSARDTQGSAARVMVYTVPPNSPLTLSVYMRCPSFGGNYWMEFGYRLGAFTAQDFDSNPVQWTLVRKFDNTGSYENGNGNTWTLYSAAFNTGTSTQLSVGFKLGSYLGAGPTVGWDTLRVTGSGSVVTGTPTPSWTPTVPSTATFTPTRTSTPLVLNDADGDGIDDALEGYPPSAGQSNRYLADSDNDSLGDGVEDQNRNGARDPGETYTRYQDSDADQLQDGIEVLFLRSDPLNPASPGTFVDADGDGLPSTIDLNDANPDTDGDFYSDGYEAVTLGLLAAYDNFTKPPLGDVTRDGFASNVDALAVQALFLSLVGPQTLATSNSDVNCDGFVTNVDALIIQSFFLRVLLRLPLCSISAP